MACCHPGVGGPIGRHDSRPGPITGRPSLPRSRRPAHPDCPFRNTRIVHFGKGANVGLVTTRPKRQSACLRTCGGMGSPRRAFCTRHYMRCPVPPRPAARINSRAPAYYSAGSCPALRERLSSRARTQPWTPKAPPDASVYPLRPPPTNTSRTAHPSSRKSSKRTTS